MREGNVPGAEGFSVYIAARERLFASPRLARVPYASSPSGPFASLGFRLGREGCRTLPSLVLPRERASSSGPVACSSLPAVSGLGGRMEAPEETDVLLRTGAAGTEAEFPFAVFRLIFASKSGRPRWK